MIWLEYSFSIKVYSWKFWFRQDVKFLPIAVCFSLCLLINWNCLSFTLSEWPWPNSCWVHIRWVTASDGHQVSCSFAVPRSTAYWSSASKYKGFINSCFCSRWSSYKILAQDIASTSGSSVCSSRHTTREPGRPLLHLFIVFWRLIAWKHTIFTHLIHSFFQLFVSGCLWCVKYVNSFPRCFKHTLRLEKLWLHNSEKKMCNVKKMHSLYSFL